MVARWVIGFLALALVLTNHLLTQREDFLPGASSEEALGLILIVLGTGFLISLLLARLYLGWVEIAGTYLARWRVSEIRGYGFRRKLKGGRWERIRHLNQEFTLVFTPKDTGRMRARIPILLPPIVGTLTVVLLVLWLLLSDRPLWLDKVLVGTFALALVLEFLYTPDSAEANTIWHHYDYFIERALINSLVPDDKEIHPSDHLRALENFRAVHPLLQIYILEIKATMEIRLGNFDRAMDLGVEALNIEKPLLEEEAKKNDLPRGHAHRQMALLCWILEGNPERAESFYQVAAANGPWSFGDLDRARRFWMGKEGSREALEEALSSLHPSEPEIRRLVLEMSLNPLNLPRKDDAPGSQSEPRT